MNTSQLSEDDRDEFEFVQEFLVVSASGMVLLSFIAFVINAYLLICSQYLRRPIGVNLRLCVSLTACDALCAICYILTMIINIFFNSMSDCLSLLLEVFKMSMFASSALTLVCLALNHYVGIVYPLHRSAITPSFVRWSIIISYLCPFTMYLFVFIAVPGGLRQPVAFDFFSSAGCRSPQIYTNGVFRWAVVFPFILLVIFLSFLYIHIMIHMRQISRDPLLKTNTKSKKKNRKLLVTLMLLAGSACIGWIPTSLNFVIMSNVPVSTKVRMYFGVVAQTLHVSKLIVDAFIYASRLVEVRYAMWMLNRSVCRYAAGLCGAKNETEDRVPNQFTRYLSETKENRSVRSKRVKSQFKPETRRLVANRSGSEKTRRSTSRTQNAHRVLNQANSIPTL